MASTYSTSLKLQLMATGENTGTWGTVTNTNLGTALEEAITGSVDVTFASADVTLTLTNSNAAQTARNMRLVLTGTSGGARQLVVPALEKIYIVQNNLADACTVKVSGQTGVSVPAGKTMWLCNDGTDVKDVVTHLSSLTLSSPLPVSSGGTGATALNGLSFTGENITSLNASNISTGTIANARTTAASANGASTIVARDASGNFSANTITANLTGTASNATQVANNLTLATSGTGLSGSATFNGSSAQTFTVTSNASSANGASTIVARDASGNFSANTVTANLTGTASNATVLQTARNFSISGGATAAAVSFNGSANVDLSVTALNASSISSGTLAIARMASGTVIKVSTITFSTRTVTSSTATYDLNIGSFTKTYDSSTSDLIVVGTIPYRSSDNGGDYLRNVIGSTANYAGFSRSVGAENNIAAFTQYWSGIGSGSQTFYTGWSTADGSSQRPINIYCQNSTDEARNRQQSIVVVIYEVLK